MSRSIKGDWISAYLKYTENTESPKSYHTWTAISCIAGALGRKVYTRLWDSRIYPNFYIILVGPSGKTRKGDAMGIGERIFKELELPMSAEAVTREALLIRMKNAESIYLLNGEKMTHSSITCFSKELTTLTGVKNVKFLADITDWYDCHSIWTNDTKNKGTDEIIGMFLNLLGATAPDWIPQILPLEAVGGGFTSRCVFVVEREKDKIIPLPRYDPKLDKIKQSLVNDLKVIKTLSGEYQLDDEAAVSYSEWYTKTEEKKAKGVYPIQDPRLHSYCERRAVHLLKLCIVLQAATNDSKVVKPVIFEKALKTLEAGEERMPDVFGGLGASQQGHILYKIIDFLKRQYHLGRKRVTRAEILTMFWADISFDELLKMESTMVTMKLIILQPDPEDISSMLYMYQED